MEINRQEDPSIEFGENKETNPYTVNDEQYIEAAIMAKRYGYDKPWNEMLFEQISEEDYAYYMHQCHIYAAIKADAEGYSKPWDEIREKFDEVSYGYSPCRPGQYTTENFRTLREKLGISGLSTCWTGITGLSAYITINHAMESSPYIAITGLGVTAISGVFTVGAFSATIRDK